MELQSMSFSVTGNHYQQTGKENKANNQRTAHALIPSKSEFDKMIENIQEQIQKVQENDHYDADTKKSKIEELEEQLKQIQEAQRTQEAEVVKGKTKEKRSHAPDTYTQVNAHGDSLAISIDMQTFIEADASLGKAKNAYSMQKNLEGQSNILRSEIKTDKGRGVNTEHKEAQLSKLTEGIKWTTDQFGEASKNANKSAAEQTDLTSSGGQADDGKLTDENNDILTNQGES